MRRAARSGGVSGMLHRTTVRRADLIEGTADSLVRNRGRIQTFNIGAVADVIRESFNRYIGSA
jgi:hypothetical protein